MNQKSAYDALLDEVCVGPGFCGSIVNGQPLHVDHFIPEYGLVTADQFVEWVFRAEGMNPDEVDAVKHATSLREAFVRHMGNEVADAQDLRR
jgi:hypothetical protein